jgi:uncharacterized protein
VPANLGPIALPERGQRQEGAFTFDDPLLGRYQWPYAALVGADTGPTFLLTAGIHAAEYTGILAAIRLIRQLDPAQIAGTIVIVPLLNQPGFYERSIYVNPEDNQNLNRAFPGSPNGTWSERFAHHLLQELVVHSDYLVDMHAGDLIEDLEPFVIYHEVGDARVDDASRRMADAYGLRFASKGRPSGERPGLLYAAAAEHGVPAITPESGRCGLVEEDAIQRHVDGMLNVWRTLGLLRDAPPRPPAPPRMLSRFEWLRSAHEGVFLCRARVNDEVRQGDELGEMVDLLGNSLGVVRAPADGVVLFTLTSPAIKNGGLLLGIGVP